ncbi:MULTISPECIES: DEAD/DEAH box helicase [unclassified Methanoregula]|uniref:DEAD/DEAH box helicase n=1 Tax=unclassified Methanoregula TaxID=2649730 RepID=UPI0009C7F9E3|nr:MULTISPECIES: DEAD/DEAH box helicase [unclassified Methanoregula]OPX64220.1 MAG: putative ski2-type helicase [Methanoregula sp. PtaB.Bin085]OPY33656.1 MAG: putative ski2-type helicase [Methanoregula sp. PtaU1.Bin006]
MSSVFPTLHESLQQILAHRLDWKELRQVQEEAYRAVSKGGDALILAPTAGGKSEAALIPVMDDVLRHGRPGIACLYISPLKALINDQEERFRAFCTPVALTVAKWHGDVARSERTWEDGEPPHFLMITPESLEVLLQERTPAPDLRQVRFIIIDELHAFVESERGVHLRVLLHRMDQVAGRKIQRIGLSATAGNPREILQWLSDGRHDAELVSVPSPPQEKQFLFIVEPEESRRIDALVRIVSGKKALVFTGSRSRAEQLVNACTGRIRNLHIHHSSVSPAARKRAEEAFGSPEGACIICTSTLELGIDIGDLDVVVQAGPPDTVSSFLQRMGRSGRRGKAAFVAWILKDNNELLWSIAIIECAMQKRVENLRPLKMPLNVLLQQLFLFLLNHPRTTRRELVSFARAVPVFREIDPRDIDRILDHLITSDYLATDGGMIMTGPGAERQFGRSNWKDLYSVISGGGEYRAVTPDGEVVGMLDAQFINSKDGGEVSLGGRSWTLVKSDEGYNIVVVVPGGTGSSRVFWTGGSEEGFSPLVCHGLQELAARKTTTLPIGRHEQELLTQALAQFPEGIGPEGLFVTEPKGSKPGTVMVFSMNGCGFNRVLAILLRHHLGKKVQVRFDDLRLIVTRAGKDGSGERVIGTIRDLQTLGNKDLEPVLPLLPADGWKFASALPEPLFRKMVISDHYHGEDFLGTLRSLTVSFLHQPEQDRQAP